MSAELDRVNELLKGIGEKPVGGGSASARKPAEPSAPETPEDFSEKSYAEQGSRGAAIGLAGYAAAPAYYAERGVRTMFPDFRINPFGWRDRYKAERDLVESTPAGIAGEVGGVVAPAFIPGVGWVASGLRAAMGAEDLARIAELARITEAGSRMSRVGGVVSRGLEALSPAERAAIVGGYSGIMSRPATSGQELAEQGLGGAALGAIGAKIAPKIAEKITPYFRRAGTPEPPAELAGVAGKGFESDIPFGTVGGKSTAPFPRNAAERAAEARGEPFGAQPETEPETPTKGPRVRNIVPRFVKGTGNELSTFVPETPSGRAPRTTPAARAARQEAADTKQMTAGAKAAAGRMSPGEALASGIQQQVIKQFGGGGLERDIARKVQQEFPPARRAAQAQQAPKPQPSPLRPSPQTVPSSFEPSASLEANQERLRDLLKNFPGLKIKPGSTRRISPNLEVLRPPRIDPSSGFGSAESQAERQAFRENERFSRRNRENFGYTLGHTLGHASGGGWMLGNTLGHLFANIFSRDNWRDVLNRLGQTIQRGTRGALATPQRAGAIAAGATAATPDLGLGEDFDINDFISQLDEARQQ